jgi:hypothetical protein
MMISDKAVEAAAKVLLGYTGGCACHEGYTGRNLIDPDCRYHDVPPEAARELLEAAAPIIAAGAWDEGAQAGLSWDENRETEFVTPNPYVDQGT